MQSVSLGVFSLLLCTPVTVGFLCARNKIVTSDPVYLAVIKQDVQRVDGADRTA